MIFCPGGAVQETASDVDVAFALMFVTRPGSVQSCTMHNLKEIVIRGCSSLSRY